MKCTENYIELPRDGVNAEQWQKHVQARTARSRGGPSHPSLVSTRRRWAGKQKDAVAPPKRRAAKRTVSTKLKSKR